MLLKEASSLYLPVGKSSPMPTSGLVSGQHRVPTFVVKKLGYSGSCWEEGELLEVLTFVANGNDLWRDPRRGKLVGQVVGVVIQLVYPQVSHQDWPGQGSRRIQVRSFRSEGQPEGIAWFAVSAHVSLKCRSR